MSDSMNMCNSKENSTCCKINLTEKANLTEKTNFTEKANLTEKTNRIDLRFMQLKKKNKMAFIPYVTAGDFGLDTTGKLILALEEAGADLIEVGIPYSDPVADGPVIQRASERALKRGTKIKDIMQMVRNVRKCTEIPLLYMLYYNCILRYGTERFLNECIEVGIDGLIVPDLPFEESAELKRLAEQKGIYLISFIAPTSSGRIKMVIEEAKGFIYCVSTTGVTGGHNKFSDKLFGLLDEIKKHSGVPRAVGFGISSNKHIQLLQGHCEAGIVGSAIIETIEKYGETEQLLEKVKELVKSIKGVEI